MPNSTKERCCPKCGETADNEDEVCSECGTELLPPEMPPGKKKCVNCPKVLPLKAKFCTKCGAPQIVERKKRTCCGENLSDDDEFCNMCGKSGSEQSGSYKQTQEESSKVERERVGEHAAPEGEGSTETASSFLDNQTLKENNAGQLEQGDEIQNDDTPNNGKRRKSQRSVSESESGQGRYNLRSNKQAGTSSNGDGPRTKVQLETSSVGDGEENKTPTLQEKAGGDVEETDAMKNFKESSQAGEFYRKGEHDHNIPSRSTNTKRSTGSKLAVEAICVTFKVVIGPEFKFDHRQHYVCMVFSSSQLGGWNATHPHQLGVERNLGDGYFLLSVTMNIPKQLLLREGTEYKYIMVSRSSTKFEWEFIMKHSYKDIHLNRSISFKIGYEKETFTQYDIIMFPNPGKFLRQKHKIVVSWGGYFHYDSYKQLMKGRHVGTLAMLPDWPGTEFLERHKKIGVDFLAEIDAVVKRMKFIILNDNFRNTDEILMAKIMCEYLQTGMQVLANIDPATDIASEQKILIAMAAVYIIASVQCDLSNENLKLICENLLPITATKGLDDEIFKRLLSHLEGYDKYVIKYCPISNDYAICEVIISLLSYCG